METSYNLDLKKVTMEYQLLAISVYQLHRDADLLLTMLKIGGEELDPKLIQSIYESTLAIVGPPFIKNN